MHDMPKKICGPLHGKFASPIGMPPRRAPIRVDPWRAWGEEGVAASESDPELEHRWVLQSKHSSIAAIRKPHLGREEVSRIDQTSPPRG